MAYSCKIITDSISKRGHRLTTFEVTFPRLVLAEFNTHRKFSRNSASSRAIPVNKQLARLWHDPFVPQVWGSNQAGMQAGANLEGWKKRLCVWTWLTARTVAIAFAWALLKIGVHKQITNRLLEPFMWHTVIVTATDWGNFFNLRANPMAQPEIQTIAYMMQEAYKASTPSLLIEGQWHLPYIYEEDRALLSDEAQGKAISSGRCARVSFLTHDGKRDHSADLGLYERLSTGGHMSPLEHPARPMTDEEYTASPVCRNFTGWVQHRAEIPGEDDILGYRATS